MDAAHLLSMLRSIASEVSEDELMSAIAVEKRWPAQLAIEDLIDQGLVRRRTETYYSLAPSVPAGAQGAPATPRIPTAAKGRDSAAVFNSKRCRCGHLHAETPCSIRGCSCSSYSPAGAAEQTAVVS